MRLLIDMNLTPRWRRAEHSEPVHPEDELAHPLGAAVDMEEKVVLAAEHLLPAVGSLAHRVLQPASTG